MAEKEYIQEYGVVLDNIKSAHINLCSTCKHTYPECPAEADDVLFGYYDNVCACAEYRSTSSADVVEVVRCKDCKHRFNYDICAYRGDNWFCGYGERSVDNGQA